MKNKAQCDLFYLKGDFSISRVTGLSKLNIKGDLRKREAGRLVRPLTFQWTG